MVGNSEFCGEKQNLVIKLSLFIANYDRKLRMRVNIKRKEKVEKVIEFAERMKKKNTRES